MTSTPFNIADTPQFETLLGQEKAKKLLIKSQSNKRMGHAFLFRGPAGVGKKRTALTFGAYINCLSPTQQDACGHCASCVKFKSGSHPDLMVIEPEGVAIKINQIRSLKRSLAFPPFEARYRVVILTDTHTMRREAANSLLKTLEEPPPNTILILTAADAGKILPTIVSRCQEIPFFALPYKAVARKISQEEGVDMETALTIAALVEGSLGGAIFLLKTNLLALRREIITALIRHHADGPESVEVIFNIAEKSANLKDNLPDLFNLLRIWFRDLILYHTGASEDMLINRDLLPFFTDAARRWNIETVFDKLDRIQWAGKQLLRNCNRAHVCEMLFFDLL